MKQWSGSAVDIRCSRGSANPLFQVSKCCHHKACQGALVHECLAGGNILGNLWGRCVVAGCVKRETAFDHRADG